MLTDILVKRFIKDYGNKDDPKVRGQYGALAGFVGILCNVLLFALKFVIGTISGSVSITADAVNNLSDASSSVVTLLGFKLSQRPPDDGHPFGHARIEYLSGLTVAALIIVIGVQLLRDSIGKILSPSPVEFSLPLVGVLLLSILLKLWMMFFNKSMGGRIGSASLAATAADSRNDVITTSAVLLSAVFTHFTGINLDGWTGALVALFILFSGAKIAKETISPLLGEPADEELTAMITKELTSFDPRVLRYHDLVVHDYGPGQRFATAHVEVDARENAMAAHEMIDNLERLFWDKHRIHMVIHYDPIVTDDAELNHARREVLDILHAIDSRISVHDFRMVRGEEHTNLIFDLALPRELEGREKEIKKSLDEKLSQGRKMRYYTVITFDSLAFNRPT